MNIMRQRDTRKLIILGHGNCNKNVIEISVEGAKLENNAASVAAEKVEYSR